MARTELPLEGSRTGASFAVTRRPADLVFDLDGTLSDPIQGIHESLNHTLQYHGFDPVPQDQAAQFIGPPLDQVLGVLTGVSDGHEMAALVAKYRERYSTVGYAENTLYPGVREALRLLQEEGITMGVCTSKRTDYATRILEMFEIREFFAFVSGGDIGVEKWEQVAELREAGAVRGQSVMIGDRAVDMTAAHRNGLSAGGVLWGYGSQEELAAERPRYLFIAPEEWSVLIP